MKEKIIGAILAGDRKIQVQGIEVLLSGYKIKPKRYVYKLRNRNSRFD